MKHKVQHIVASLLTGLCLMVGCDKSDDTAPPPLAPLIEPNLNHPTTQQLISGPRTPLEIKFAPVTLKVPTGWEVKSYNNGSMVTLEGSTPTDVVSISIPVYRTITADQERLLEAGATADFASHPDLLPKLGVRDLGGAKLVERLVLTPPSAAPTSQTAGQAAPQGAGGAAGSNMMWTFTVCVPSTDGKSYSAYDLRFLAMTLKQYTADQAFLRSVMDSMTYTPSALDPLPNTIPDTLPK